MLGGPAMRGGEDGKSWVEIGGVAEWRRGKKGAVSSLL